MTSLLAAQLARRQSLISLVPDRASWPPDLGRSGPTPSSEMPQRSTLRQGPNPGGHLLGTPPAGVGAEAGVEVREVPTGPPSIQCSAPCSLEYSFRWHCPSQPLPGLVVSPTPSPSPLPPTRPQLPRRRPQAGLNLPPQQGPLRGQLSHSFILCMRKLSPREGNRLPEALHLVAHEMQGPPSPGMTS